jgi:multiple sugar transport system substrate-binding protein
VERRIQQQGVPGRRGSLDQQRHLDLRGGAARSHQEGYREDMDHAYFPIGPVGKPTELHLMFPLLAMTHTKYPQACKALMAFMQEAPQFNPWIEAADGYLTPCLAAYDANPVWTSDPKRTPYRDVAKRSLTVGGLGSVGEKAASAVSDFVLVDMFASYCTGREDAKGAIKIAERQLQRIYR